MKTKLLQSLTAFILLLTAENNFAQTPARIVMGSGTPVYMNMSGGIYLVVGDNTASSAPNTITAAANAWIISDGNGTANNRIKWYIGNAAAGNTYTVPFGRSTTNYIPLTLTIGSAGTAGGPIIFSTYRTSSWQNSANLPTTGTFPPTNYNSPSIPGDASAYGVDRFWEIDATNYGATKPDLSSLIFSYVDAGEVVAGSNTINEGNLQAQRWNFNAAIPSWEGGIFLKGTDTPGSDIVTLSGAAVVSGASDLSNSRWWTLIDKSHPLPVQWLRESAECNKGNITVRWSTASEQNSDFFTVEKSIDGTNFTAVSNSNIIAAGNSSTIRNYSAIDLDPYSGVSYYRIRETDFNSSFMFSAVMTITGCSNNDVFVYGSEGGLTVNIHAVQDGQYTVELYDLLGQKVMDEIKNVTAGDNHMKMAVPNIASAMYIAKVYNSNSAVTKKVFIRSAYSQ